MKTPPSLTSFDADWFEAKLTEYLKEATPEQMIEYVGVASRFLEFLKEPAKEHGTEMRLIKNATSAACRVAVELATRLATAQSAKDGNGVDKTA